MWPLAHHNNFKIANSPLLFLMSWFREYMVTKPLSKNHVCCKRSLGFFGGCRSEPQQFQRSKNWTVHINSNGCNEQGRASKEALLRTLWKLLFCFLFCFRISCLWFSVAGAAKIYEHMWFCVWQVWQEYMWSVACLWAWQVWPKYVLKKLVLVRARGRCGKNNVCVAGLAIRHGVSVSVLVAGAVITIWVYVSMQTEAVVWKALHSHLRHSHHGTFSH